MMMMYQDDVVRTLNPVKAGTLDSTLAKDFYARPIRRPSGQSRYNGSTGIEMDNIFSFHCHKSLYIQFLERCRGVDRL